MQALPLWLPHRVAAFCVPKEVVPVAVRRSPDPSPEMTVPFPSVPPPPLHHFVIRIGGADYTLTEPAAIKSWMLLLRFLSPAQRADMENLGKIRVTGSAGGLFEIDMSFGPVGNVTSLDPFTGMRISGHCAHLSLFNYPLADHYLAQIMTIRLAEGKFRSTAY